MLNAGVHPVVGETGSLGASDIGHMAMIADVAIGRGRARLNGETLPGSEALAQAGIEPYELQPKDALAMVSANGASIGIGALTVLEAERLAQARRHDRSALARGRRGKPEPLRRRGRPCEARPRARSKSARHVRELLSGSYLEDPDAADSVQDPLSFRVVPQVHGALREQIAAARDAVELELNAIDDNPLASVEQDTMLSNGNFHPMVLALAFESLRVGLAHVGMISERRIRHVSALGRQTSPDFKSTAEKEASPSPLDRLPNVTFDDADAGSRRAPAPGAPVTLECSPDRRGRGSPHAGADRGLLHTTLAPGARDRSRARSARRGQGARRADGSSRGWVRARGRSTRPCAASTTSSARAPRPRMWST